MEPTHLSSHLAQSARAADRDRFLCALFAPVARRDLLFALTLFNTELARIPDMVSQPMTGLIRYQWWRDAIADAANGKVRAHPVSEALRTGLAQGILDAVELEKLVDAREGELEWTAPENLEALEGYVQSTSGRLHRLWLQALGGSAAEMPWVEALGVAYGLTGVVRAAAWHAASRRSLVPVDMAADRVALSPALRRITARATELIAQARATAGRPRRSTIAAYLPGYLARLYAREIEAAAYDPTRCGSLGTPPLAALRLLAATMRRRF